MVQFKKDTWEIDEFDVASIFLLVGTEKAMAVTGAKHIPRAVVVNSMDRENANFDKVYGELKETFPGVSFAPLMLPIMDKGAFVGYTITTTGKSYQFAGKKGEVKEIETSQAMKDRIEELMESLVEAAAGADDELMEKFFEEGTLSEEDMLKGLSKGIADGDVTPVFCCAAVPCLGVSKILDYIVDVFPSPEAKGVTVGKNPKDGSEISRPVDASAPFSAQVFKTLADPFVGKISLLKVYSGTLTSDTTFVNANNDKTAKAGSVSVMRGKKLIAVDKLIAGDIGVLTKLQFTATGDTLCAASDPIVYPFPEFPQPCISMAVYAKNKGDEDKIFSSLARLTEEDPSFTIEKDPVTTETIISGQGDESTDLYRKADDLVRTMKKVVVASVDEKQEEDEQKLTDDILSVVKEALAKFNAMREKEGAAMEADLRSRAKTVLSLVEKVEARSPVTLAEYRARLEQKLRALGADIMRIEE